MIAEHNQVNRPSSAGSILHGLHVWLWLGFALVPALLSAQTNSPAPVYRPNRYLVIVETSHSMQRRLDALTQSVRNILGSAVAAQAHRGDGLGIWTFNEELYTGLLPLQKWSPENKVAITDRVVGFVRAQKFEKTARFEKIMPTLDRVVRSSPFITVILVCQGEEEIHGTTFDGRINDFFRTWHSQQQNSAAPFVIALRAQAGRWVDCSMNPSPWPPELPGLPKELLTPIVPHSLAKDSAKPATSNVPPLIISGKRKETAAPATPQSSGATNATVATNPTPADNPAAPAQALAANSPSSTPPDPSSGSAAGTNPAVTPAAPSVAAAPEPVHSGSSSASPPPTVASPEPVPTPGLDPASGNSPSTPTANPPSDHSPEPAMIPKPVATAPVEVATTAQPPRLSHSLILGAAALVLVLTVAGAILVWRKQARAGRETSLITESIDRRKE